MKTVLHEWRHRLAESFSRRLAAPLSVAWRDEQKLFLDRRGKDLTSYFQSCGQGVSIPGCLIVTDPASVAVGHGVSVGEDGHWSAAGGLTIGDRTRIGRRVIIETVERAAGAKHDAQPRPVLIGPDVWIGDGVVLLPGTRLGAGSAVTSGAVVSGAVPSGAIVRPAPAVVAGPDAGPTPVAVPTAVSSGGGAGHGDDAATRLFFVVSTGRSGSQTIAKALSQHPRVTCLHEPRPQMIRLSTELAHGVKTAGAVEEELRAIFCEGSVFPADRWHGESDQKYWNLIPFLAELAPQSRFIWLIRDGRDVVASTMSRDWFPTPQRPGDPISHDLHQRWQYYRLDGARCGRFTEAEWNQRPLFEKHCWHWAHVNSTIETSLSALPAERGLTVRLEELASRTADIFRFLGLEAEPVNVETRNKSLYKIKPHADRSADERACFERWCGAFMDRWYPGWRD